MAGGYEIDLKSNFKQGQSDCGQFGMSFWVLKLRLFFAIDSFWMKNDSSKSIQMDSILNLIYSNSF